MQSLPENISTAMLMELIKQGITLYSHPLKVFGLDGTKEYAKQVAGHLNIELTPHVEKSFEDGECYAKSSDGDEGNVRGHDVFVIQSLYGDETESVSDKFMKLAIFVGSLRGASANTITVVIPHLGWARQDRKTESRAPVTTKVVASMLESVGIDHAVFMDVHNLSAEQNAFSLRCPTDNLESKKLHAEWCAKTLPKNAKITVLTPDSGGFARAVRFRNALQKLLNTSVQVAFLDKLRVDGSVEYADTIVGGSVEGTEVLIYDDMISTGGTMTKAYHAVNKFGGHVHAICATHGLFVGKANQYLDEIGASTRIVIADTVEPWRLSPSNRGKVDIVSTSKMTADAIWRIHSGTGSISALLR